MPRPIVDDLESRRRLRKWRNMQTAGYADLRQTVCQLEHECNQWEDCVRLFCSAPGITSAQLAEAIKLLTSK